LAERFLHIVRHCDRKIDTANFRAQSRARRYDLESSECIGGGGGSSRAGAGASSSVMHQQISSSGVIYMFR
jgi:hypothetical protein